MGDGEVTGRYFHTHKRGVDRVFIDHPCFLAKVWGKTGSKIYGNKTGVDYPDNQLRFSAFCQAALQAPLLLDLKNNPKFSGTYGEDVIFVANDWHTALVPAYLKSMYQSAGIFSSARVAYCVHNIAYQGRFPAEDFNLLNVPNQFKSAFTFTTAAAKTPGPKINWMKTGFMLSDKNFTVSPNYAKEITSGPSLGVELDSVIKQSGGIKGIINGMDVVEWNPATDKYLDTPYDESCPEVKMEIKAQLQAEVGLPVNPDVPLMVFVGRLEEQKGSDILIQSLPQILQNNCQLLVLGTGKKKYEKQLEQLEEMYPNKARGIVKFNVPLAHAMTAGADFFVVPSRFEPCGLIQLHAMRYGTVPIVASTGGLVDTVPPHDPRNGVGTGFCFDRFEPVDFYTTLVRAWEAYRHQDSWRQLQLRGMREDYSWARSALEYDQMYRDVCGLKEPGPDAAAVERFSQGQEADPSRNAAVDPQPEQTPQSESRGRGSRNPLARLLRQSRS